MVSRLQTVSLTVCLSVCLLTTFVSPAKMAEPIDQPFWMVTLVGPWYHVLDGGQDLQREGQFWGRNWQPIVKYRDTLLSAVQKRLNRSRCHLVKT